MSAEGAIMNVKELITSQSPEAIAPFCWVSSAISQTVVMLVNGP